MGDSCVHSKATHTFVGGSGAPVVSYDRAEQPLDLITEACTNLEVALGADVYLVLNCAAQKLMDYVSYHKSTNPRWVSLLL